MTLSKSWHKRMYNHRHNAAFGTVRRARLFLRTIEGTKSLTTTGQLLLREVLTNLEYLEKNIYDYRQEPSGEIIKPNHTHGIIVETERLRRGPIQS